MAPNQEGQENKAADFLQLSKTKNLLQSDELYQVYNFLKNDKFISCFLNPDVVN